MTKVGLYGGAFDPVHNGHIALAKAVVDYFNLNKLVFIPSKNPPHKKPHMACGTHRFNMLNLVANSLGESFSVSDTELVSDGVSYTFNTVSKWIEDNPLDDVYFISGSDIFVSVESWHRWQELLNIVKFIVVKRSGFGFDKMFSYIKSDFSEMINNGRLLLFDGDIDDISSSFLRGQGRFEPCFVPEAVLEYIKTYKLYEG